MGADLLVLWDIDHTLLKLGRLHYDLYTRAFPIAFGRPVESLPEMTGRTDADITALTLEANHVEVTPDNVARMWTALAAEVDAVAADLPGLGHPTPGSTLVVTALADMGGVHQSVLTGNVRHLAEVKLGAFGFGRWLDFEVGGYGEDSPRRGDLVAAARRRFRDRFGAEVALSRVVLVGDSPLDIQAARDSGARIVAVATGKSSVALLSEADAVLPDLLDTAAAVATILTTAEAGA